MYRRRRVLEACLTAATLAVAGCTGREGTTDPADDDGDGADDEDETDADRTDTARPTEEETETPATDDDEEWGGRIDPVSTVGLVEDGAISAVEIAVATASSDGRIDLADATIQWIDDGGVYDLVAASGDATGDADGTFRITPIKDADDSAPALNAPGDRMRLSMALGAAAETDGVRAFGKPLEPGSQARLALETQTGIRTTIALTVPETLGDSEAVTL